MVVSANIDLSIGRIMRYPIFTHRDVKSFFSRHLSIFCCFFSCLNVEIVFIVVVRWGAWNESRFRSIWRRTGRRGTLAGRDIQALTPWQLFMWSKKKFVSYYCVIKISWSSIKLPFVWPFGRCCRDCALARRKSRIVGWWPWLAPCLQSWRCSRCRIESSTRLEHSTAYRLDVISVRVRSPGYCKPAQNTQSVDVNTKRASEERPKKQQSTSKTWMSTS